MIHKLREIDSHRVEGGNPSRAAAPFKIEIQASDSETIQ